jgi:hypothetical protein
MPLSKLVFKPGINRDQTDYASEGGWFEMDKVRFRSGFPEKIGGWVVRTIEEYVGICRSLFTWITTDGNKLIGVGTNEKIYVSAGTSLNDITPIRVTYTNATVPSSSNCFQTTNGSQLVQILNITAGCANGDWVTFSGITTAVGGVPAANFNNEFQIQEIGGLYYIQVATTATSSATSTGNTNITAAFQVGVGNAIVVAGYGWGAGAWSRGTWGSGATTPIYSPARLIFQDNFNNDLIFNYNNGDLYYWAYDNTFASRAVRLASVPGAIAVPQQVGMSFFSAEGYLFAFSCTNYQVSTVTGAVMSSMTRGGTGNLTATVTTTTDHGLQSGDYITVTGTTPTQFNGTFQITYIDTTHFSYTMASAPSGNASPVGTYVYNNYNGVYDPLLIRWANVSDDIGPEPEVWNQDLATTTAGSLRLQSGSRIISALNTRQEILVWTDTSMSSIQFTRDLEVYRAQELSHNTSLMGPNAVAGINNIVYWMGRDKFYSYSGRVDTLPCTIRQYVFTDINQDQNQIIFAGTNNQFNEIIWFYCSANSNIINRYVVYNYSESIWYYGTISRTAWIDSGNFTLPLAAINGWIYDHESGPNDGQPLNAPPVAINSYIKSADVDIDDGDKFMLIRRVIPDLNFGNSQTTNPVTGAPITPEVDITVGVRNFPGAVTSTTNAEGVATVRNIETSATIDQYTNQVFIRARGRQLNFKIASNTVGTQWQLGMPRIDARPDGLRG